MTESSKPEYEVLLADIATRILALMGDLFIVLLFSQSIHTYLVDAMELGFIEHRYTLLITAWLYFSLSWTSSLQSTPMQFLLGMRVVDKTGSRLTIQKAFLRSLLLLGLLFAAMTIIIAPDILYNATFFDSVNV